MKRASMVFTISVSSTQPSITEQAILRSKSVSRSKQIPVEVEVQKRCARNRKRSKRRAIYCPIHGCYLDSASPKHSLYVDSAQQLQSRGVSRKSALMLVAQRGSIVVSGEWLEAFWCPQCETIDWYHVRRVGDREYDLSPVPQGLWKQAVGVIDPNGNVSVSEFTRRHSRMVKFGGVKDFRFL